MDLFQAAHRCLMASTVDAKLTLTHETGEAFRRGELSLQAPSPPEPIGEPGRPGRPRLVSPRELPHRGLGTAIGRAGFLHAIAHIEFNAINLAWDAVYRFRDMPDRFYADWVSVAVDEARHFRLLDDRLGQLGYRYGDFDGHDGLWQMTVKTAHCCRTRMALVPRVLEARGLDVTPGMIEKLTALGDTESVAILDTILREEVAHVAAGTRWFEWCCRRDGIAPEAEFVRLISEHAQGAIRGPFNVSARRVAGFGDGEMAALIRLADTRR
jgi:uncharacterized ferritin-like protein (DUF455 family)